MAWLERHHVAGIDHLLKRAAWIQCNEIKDPLHWNHEKAEVTVGRHLPNRFGEVAVEALHRTRSNGFSPQPMQLKVVCLLESDGQPALVPVAAAAQALIRCELQEETAR